MPHAHTPTLIDTLVPPATGERWVADAAVPGFGLHLWAGKKGGGAAYCLRAKDGQGRWPRRQFDPHRDGAANAWLAGETPRTLGDWLPHARLWAETERNAALGDRAAADAERKASRARRRHAEETPLGAHIQWYLSDGPGVKMSEAYRDHTQNLVFSYLLADLLDRPLGTILPQDLIGALVRPDRPLATIASLRHFLSRLLRDPALENAGSHLIAAKTTSAFHRALRDLWAPDYQSRLTHYEPFRPAILALIEAEEVRYIAAAFLRVYLGTGAKQRPLLVARWDRIVGNRWFPYLPSERRSWFLASEILSPDLMEFLTRYRTRLEAEFGASPWMFPSRPGDGQGPHITSVHRYWRQITRRAGWDSARNGPIPLIDFARICQTRTAPSSFMDPNSPMQRAIIGVFGNKKEKCTEILSKIGKLY